LLAYVVNQDLSARKHSLHHQVPSRSSGLGSRTKSGSDWTFHLNGRKVTMRERLGCFHLRLRGRIRRVLFHLRCVWPRASSTDNGPVRLCGQWRTRPRAAQAVRALHGRP
jgi:hypothetical protein